MVRCMHDVIDQSLKPPFAELFKISYCIGKACIFNKNEGNNQNVENILSGKVRVGVGWALLYQLGGIQTNKYKLSSDEL